MKKLTRLLAVVLAVMMLSAILGTIGAHAEGERKIFVSHFNQDDVYSNASVIFTKAYMDANGYSTLSDVTRAYNAKVSEKVQSIDPDWTARGNSADHKFAGFFTMSIAWDEDNGYYKVIEAVTANGGEIVCPDNGFLLSVHRDLKASHGYASTPFGERNLGTEAEQPTVIAQWKAFKDQPVYLYNIDLEANDAASAIKTSGTFESKLSDAGLNNGMVEVFQNFSTESYIMLGGEDPDATTASFEPTNVTVSFKRIENLQADIAKNYYEPDYTAKSWAALQAALKAHEIGDASMTNKDVGAWAEEIKEARDALILADSPEAEAEAEEEAKSGNKGGNGFVDADTTGSGDSTLIIIIVVAAVLVLGGAAFLIFALKKKNGGAASEAPAAPAAEEKTEEPKEEETKEEPKDE